MSLIDITKTFPTEDDCLEYLERMRWPEGVRCPACSCDRISRIVRRSVTKNKRTRFYQCLGAGCRQQFTATSGTVFADSRLPLTKWFMALAIVADAKKSISANQLKQHLGIGSYRTAWYLAHRIRKAMEARGPAKLDDIGDADDASLRGKIRTKDASDRQNESQARAIALGMKQREQRLRLKQIRDRNTL